MKEHHLLFVTDGYKVSIRGRQPKHIKSLKDFFDKHPNAGLSVIFVEAETDKGKSNDI